MKRLIYLSTFWLLEGTMGALTGPWAFELVEIIKINPNIKLDIRYATTNNFTHKKIYPSFHCFLQKSTATKLDKVQKELEKKGLGLKVFDGYRSVEVQKIFWKICPDSRYVANPYRGGSKHNRGAAVDLTLIDLKTGKELEMSSGFDDFTEKAYRNYGKMKPLVRCNCKLLEDAMVKYGFIPEPTEWWHFNDAEWKNFPAM